MGRQNARLECALWRHKAAKVQDLHFHDLRHTFTTRLQNLGVSLELRSALLGHSTKAVMTSIHTAGKAGI